MNMDTVVFITTSISYGGASKMLIFVAEMLLAKGYKVSIINLRQGLSAERNVNKDINIYNVDCKVNFFTKFQQICKIYKIVKRVQPNVIITFKYNPNLIGAIIGKITNIPIIISERADPKRTESDNNTSIYATINRIKARVFWKIINSADGAVFQTNGAKSSYSPYLKKMGTIIANPVFIDQGFRYYTGVKENNVVTFGRLANKQKRYDIMLDAFSIFQKNHSDYILKIYGNGPDEELINKWIIEKGLIGKVKMMGISDNPMRDIQHDKIFLITSDFEGISNSLLEAMAAGLPVVSTDSSPGGARMVINDHEDGIIVPCGDPNSIAEALSIFADDDDFREKCALNARKVIDRFSPTEIGNEWEEYIKKIIAMNN